MMRTTCLIGLFVSATARRSSIRLEMTRNGPGSACGAVLLTQPANTVTAISAQTNRRIGLLLPFGDAGHSGDQRVFASRGGEKRHPRIINDFGEPPRVAAKKTP